MRFPVLALVATTGSFVRLPGLDQAVIFADPRTGAPDSRSESEWEAIPDALLIGADAEHREWLSRLGDDHYSGMSNHDSVELSHPKARSDPERVRRVQSSRDKNGDRLDR
jgi:hypothetical protein